MKAILLFCFGLCVFGFTSCVKTSLCKCTSVDLETQEVTTSNETIQGVSGFGGSKKDREKQCKSYEYTNAFISKTCVFSN